MRRALPGSPADLCPFPNLGKAACAQVRKRDSASNAQQVTHPHLLLQNKAESQKATVASLHVCWGREKGIWSGSWGLIPFAIAPEWSHCPARGHPSLHPEGGGEEGYTWTMESQQEHCTWSQDEHRARGLACAPQVVADPVLERHRAVLDPKRISRVENF